MKIIADDIIPLIDLELFVLCQRRMLKIINICLVVEIKYTTTQHCRVRDPSEHREGLIISTPLVLQKFILCLSSS